MYGTVLSSRVRSAFQVYHALKDAHEGLIVYKKADILERFHDKDHQRVPPILLAAQPGYVILRVSILE